MMAKPIAISGSLVNMRNVGTHKSVALTVHVPEEQAAAIIAAFGWPTMVNPVAVALARMAGQGEPPAAEPEPEPAKERRKMNELPLVTQASLLCKREAFWRFLGEHGWICSDEAAAAEILRQTCRVASRSDLKPGTDEAARFWKLQGDFDVWMRAAA